MLRDRCVLFAACVGLLSTFPGSNSAVAADDPVVSIVVSTAALASDNLQEDFPAMCLDSGGTPWVAYVEFDGKADRLKVARKNGDSLEPLESLAGPSVIHQPAIACDGKGAVWAVWSQFDLPHGWKLHAKQIVGKTIQSETVTLDDDSGSAIFAHAGTDRKGRVWVVWQSFRQALGDVYAKHYDPATGEWSGEICVTSSAAGDWEPRLAFCDDDAAWVVFDSSRNDNFNVYLARVDPKGKTELTRLSDSSRYQGRASIAATPDGKGLWVAWENGRDRWGKNTRGVAGATGLNGDKRIEVVHYDVASGKITPAADVTPLLKTAGAPKNPPKPKPGQRKPGIQPVLAVNLPEIVVDEQGNPWIACRYSRNINWSIAVSKYSPAGKVWTEPVTLANSTFSQDRRANAARDAAGRLWFAWPSDLRKTKQALFSGVYLAEIDASAELAVAELPKAKPAAEPKIMPAFGDDTPERSRDDHHQWTIDGKKYALYWGDFHRHTDISNCRTAEDGCIVEQFRYAYDAASLDFLGTSDHTDIGKPYDPYEWWCNQKLADVFYVPDFFNSFYVYEREQVWPWGHRNVIFRERGGPIIYIKRELYKSMPWHANLPAGEGGAEILPKELWQLLRQNGMDVSIISHTGATGMGTDWDLYGEIDSAVENLVEIYQGARVSYEGIGAPQPTVGFVKNKKLEADAHGSVQTARDFGRYNKGVYQNALQNGYKLGVFANSDHISTHTSFGGVYVESFTREGILEGLNARRTVAGTDKVFMEFTCNGHMLGEVFETSQKPTMKVLVEGTATLKAVTIVRNEVNIRLFSPEDSNRFETSFTDEDPIVGENRYYVRVEQTDGNMGWTSPVWVTFKEK